MEAGSERGPSHEGRAWMCVLPFPFSGAKVAEGSEQLPMRKRSRGLSIQTYARPDTQHSKPEPFPQA